MTYLISNVEAKAIVSSLTKIGNIKDDAMMAFVATYGATGVNDLHDDPGSEDHDGAWNALAALEYACR